MQRAHSQDYRFSIDTEETLDLQITTKYLDTSAATSVTISVETVVSADDTPREILNAAAEAIIAQQPTGYALESQDVILTSLERG